MRIRSFKHNQLIYLVLILATLSGCARKPEAKEAGFLEAGRKHLQARDFNRAVLDFRNAERVAPKDAEPHYQLGLTYLDAGNAQAAASELMQAARLDPKHVGAQLRLAEIMTVNRNLNVVKGGKTKAQEVLLLSPDNPDALQTLAFAELRLEDSQDAIQHLDQALQHAPQHLKAATTLAMAKLQKNDIAGAEQVMLKAVAGAPQSVEHALALGYFYMQIRKSTDAEKQFRRALEIDPKFGPALIALGGLFYRDGKKNEAGQLFQRASVLPDKQYRPLHAIFLLETGNIDQAILEFTQQYQADPQDREGRTHLVSAYIRLGRTADAANVLAEAIKRNAKDTDALIQRGELNLLAGKYQEAQTDLTDVLKFHADSPAVHLVMARIHRARNATASQVQELTEALRLNPKLLAARIELAHAFTLDNAPKSAIQLLEYAPEADQQSLPVIVERNTALYALGDYAQMRKGINQGLALSRTPAFLLQDGLLNLKQNNFSAARASLQEALKQQPQDWKAVEGLALTYIAENKPVEATGVVRQYTSLAPKSVPAQQLLGSWLAATGELAGARSAFQAVKSLAPTSTEADFGLAQVSLEEGKLDSARDTLVGILDREPRNTGALLRLAAIEERASRPMGAIDYYERVIQEEPANIPALNNVAYLLADTGKDPDRALALAQKVKELAPENANIDDTIGWAYYNKGLYQASLDYLGKAANGGTPRRKCHLAMAYIKLGDRQRALTLLQSALKAEPSLPEAQKALGLLAQAH